MTLLDYYEISPWRVLKDERKRKRMGDVMPPRVIEKYLPFASPKNARKLLKLLSNERRQRKKLIVWETHHFKLFNRTTWVRPQ